MALPINPLDESPWAETNFTSPDSIHGNEKYKLIVHGIQENFLEHFIKDPDKFLQSKLISASVISNEKQGVFTQTYFGVVLQVPSELVYASSPNTNFEDMHVRNRLSTSREIVDELERISRVNHLITPDQLLERTPKKWYNEIVILGSNQLIDSTAAAVSVSVNGIFVKDGDRRLTRHTLARLKSFAEQRHLKVVLLKSDI